MTLLGLFQKTNSLGWLERITSKTIQHTNDTTYKDTYIEKELRRIWTWLTYFFERPAVGFINGFKLEEDDCPTLRSASQEIDDWIVNLYLADRTYTNQRKLDCYPIKQLWVSEAYTCLLFLVNVEDGG